MFRSVVAAVVFTCIALVSQTNLSAAEPADCPFPWLIGQFHYSDSTGESHTVTFDVIDQNAVRGSWAGSNGETGTEVVGWHPATKKIVVTGFESDGSYWQIEGTDVTTTSFSGHMVNGERDGTQNEGTFTITIKNTDLATTLFEGKDQNGEPVTIKGKFERLGKTATVEDFKEFGSLMVGRWSGDVTLIADWPGQKKKVGDKIISYATRRWVSDGHAIVATTHAGTAIGNEFWTFDPASKQIKISRTDSGGTFLDVTIWKETSTKWGWSIGGGQLDGKKLGGTGHWIFSGNGSTAVLQGDVTLDGEPLPKLKDTLTRLNEK